MAAWILVLAARSPAWDGSWSFILFSSCRQGVAQQVLSNSLAMEEMDAWIRCPSALKMASYASHGKDHGNKIFWFNGGRRIGKMPNGPKDRKKESENEAILEATRENEVTSANRVIATLYASSHAQLQEA
ncbi:hypothetical protein SELMODRAFT_427983 [Selaginella moellendorffii]|uniref:Uncharacterized protein n=1 Tax=Selaginella moellendorffii TaxID=88036 RepID=D8T1B8_SELML|nr:hypothetical protein SELMODRAFT_427983 [Selaginella moellendorffii]